MPQICITWRQNMVCPKKKLHHQTGIGYFLSTIFGSKWAKDNLGTFPVMHHLLEKLQWEAINSYVCISRSREYESSLFGCFFSKILVLGLSPILLDYFTDCVKCVVLALRLKIMREFSVTTGLYFERREFKDLEDLFVLDFILHNRERSWLFVTINILLYWL
jgi:hypothetical protein